MAWEPEVRRSKNRPLVRTSMYASLKPRFSGPGGDLGRVCRTFGSLSGAAVGVYGVMGRYSDESATVRLNNSTVGGVLLLVESPVRGDRRRPLLRSSLIFSFPDHAQSADTALTPYPRYYCGIVGCAEAPEIVPEGPGYRC